MCLILNVENSLMHWFLCSSPLDMQTVALFLPFIFYVIHFELFMFTFTAVTWNA